MAPAKQTQERSVHELFTGAFWNKSSMSIVLVFQKKIPEFTNMGKIHELFVLALSLVWFAGATSEPRKIRIGALQTIMELGAKKRISKSDTRVSKRAF